MAARDGAARRRRGGGRLAAARRRHAARAQAAEGGTRTYSELAGALRPAAGSFVGCRVDETLIGIGLDAAVGRTGEVRGSTRIEGGRIVDARFEVDTRTLRSDEARRDDALRSRGLETDRYTDAGFVLGPPARIAPRSAPGGR